MTYEQIKERFTALLAQVEQAHDKCKEDHTVPILFETFYRVHFLGVAFMQDCQQFATSMPPSDLMEILAQISVVLQCSIGHLHLSAEKLNSSDLLNKTIYKIMYPDKADPVN